MVNKLMLVGRLGKTPELSTVGSGTPLCRFSVATSHRYKDANGQKQEKTEWHNCSVFGKMAEIAAQYGEKGGQIYVEGRIETNEFKDSQGVQKTFKNVIVNNFQFISSGKRDESRGYAAKPAQAAAQPAMTQAYLDDEIPF